MERIYRKLIVAILGGMSIFGASPLVARHESGRLTRFSGHAISRKTLTRLDLEQKFKKIEHASISSTAHLPEIAESARSSQKDSHLNKDKNMQSGQVRRRSDAPPLIAVVVGEKDCPIDCDRPNLRINTEPHENGSRNSAGEPLRRRSHAGIRLSPLSSASSSDSESGSESDSSLSSKKKSKKKKGVANKRRALYKRHAEKIAAHGPHKSGHARRPSDRFPDGHPALGSVRSPSQRRKRSSSTSSISSQISETECTDKEQARRADQIRHLIKKGRDFAQKILSDTEKHKPSDAVLNAGERQSMEDIENGQLSAHLYIKRSRTARRFLAGLKHADQELERVLLAHGDLGHLHEHLVNMLKTYAVPLED